MVHISRFRALIHGELSVLKRCVPKTLAFAFSLRLRSKTRCFKTRVLGRRLPNGKPQQRLRFRDLRSKTIAFKKRIAIAFCDSKTSLGARACVQVLCVQKTRRFAFAFLSPLRRRESTRALFGILSHPEFQGCQNGAFGKRSFCVVILVDFRPEEQNPCFCG